jgi:hypothetical protein
MVYEGYLYSLGIRLNVSFFWNKRPHNLNIAPKLPLYPSTLSRISKSPA